MLCNFDRSLIILKQQPSHLLGKIAYFRAAVKQIFNLCHLIMKWWVNEIKLPNFMLNLNEKLYLLIFAKRIRPKYFQKLTDSLKYFLRRWKNVRKKNCLNYFGINVSWYQEPTVILKKLSSFSSCRHIKCFLFCWTVI